MNATTPHGIKQGKGAATQSTGQKSVGLKYQKRRNDENRPFDMNNSRLQEWPPTTHNRHESFITSSSKAAYSNRKIRSARNGGGVSSVQHFQQSKTATQTFQPLSTQHSIKNGTRKLEA
jgi:hypothetical protein